MINTLPPSDDRFKLAVATFDRATVAAPLRIAWWLHSADPLAAQVVAEAALSAAKTGYILGVLTLSTATRVRLIAESLGARPVPGDTPIA